MGQHNSEYFVNAIIKEFNDRLEREHCSLISKSKVTDRVKVREIIKYKARLNIHRGKQQHGVNYFEKNPPIVDWWAIKLIFTLALISA